MKKKAISLSHGFIAWLELGQCGILLSPMFALIVFLVLLSVLVVMHELGHYFAARWMGVKAEEFGIGFPPRLFGWAKKKGDTIWSINWLPLGGFVRLKGEQGDHIEDQDAFASKGKAARFFILSAGVIMNWLVAILIFSVGFMVGVPADVTHAPQGAIVRDQYVQITRVLNSGPAYAAGVRVGDKLLEINDGKITTTQSARDRLKDLSVAQDRARLMVNHQGAVRVYDVEFAYLSDLAAKGVGIGMADIGVVRFPIHQAIVQGVWTVGHYTFAILGGFGDLIERLIQGRGVGGDVSGPVGIAVMTGQVAKQGFWSLMQFAAILSINLAIVNALPIPALDGGRMLFVLIESFRRKRISSLLEGRFHQAGFVALLVIILVVTIYDVSRYGGSLLHFFSSLL